MDDRMPRLAYTGTALDRAATGRKHDAFVASAFAADGARLLPMRGDLNFVVDDAATPAAHALRLTAALRATLRAAGAEPVLLGLRDGDAYFTTDLAALDDDALAQALGAGTFRAVRDVRAQVGDDTAALMAYARAMLHWHRTHGFCSVCGAATRPGEGGHLRRCANGHAHYPRISPAVIMLVTTPPDEPPQCVLGRHGGLPPGMYSTLAGFVEPGESLEETVAREVAEEVGLRVDRIAYRASQPWPFPASLMVGFHAQAAAQPLRVDPDELDDARWFSLDEVRAFGEVDQPGALLRLPRRDSVARFLVDLWLARYT
jgi:NAD+ diphosphatase